MERAIKRLCQNQVVPGLDETGQVVPGLDETGKVVPGLDETGIKGCSHRELSLLVP